MIIDNFQLVCFNRLNKDTTGLRFLDFFFFLRIIDFFVLIVVLIVLLTSDDLHGFRKKIILYIKPLENTKEISFER